MERANVSPAEEPPASPDDLIIELIDNRHDTKSFTCIEPAMVQFLLLNAKKNTRYGFGRTYVAVKPGCNRVWAFYTLAARDVDVKVMWPKKGPEQIAMALLARLAVDASAMRRGIGEKLLTHSFEMAYRASLLIGLHGVVLDAKDRARMDYYEQYGFTSLNDDPCHMFLAMTTIEKGLVQQGLIPG